MRHRILFFLVICGLLSVTDVLAQRRISGVVRSDAGILLPGASVILRYSDTGSQRYGLATSLDGQFLFDNVDRGQYELTASFIGFTARSVHVDVRDGDRTDLVLELSERTLPQGEVVVSGNRMRLQLQPVTFSNITSRELERLPEMKDLPVHLARQPSITYHSENGNGIGYSTLRMRGFDQRRLAISINGIPQNDPEEFNVFWINFFDIQGAVEDIQIQRGAGSSVYGPAAIGGAINIRAMPYRSRAHVRAEIGTGSYDTRRYSLEVNSGLLGGRYVLFGRLSRLLSDGYRDWSWTEFWRFFAGITRYGPRSTLTIQTFGGPQRDGLAYTGIPKAANKKKLDDGAGGTIDRKYNFSSFDRDIEDFHQPHIELHHDLSLSDYASLNQVFFWIQGKGYFDFGGTFRSADYLRLPQGLVQDDARAEPLYISKPDASLLFRAYLDQWQIGWLPGVTIHSGRNTYRVGSELRLHRSLRWGRIQQAAGIPEYLVGSENDVRVYSFRGEKAIASAYGSALVRAADRWALHADFQITSRTYRVYEESFFGNNFSVPYLFFNPRIGLTFNPERDVSAYVSVALANREPRMKSLYDGEEAGAGFVPAFAVRDDGSLDTDSPLVKAEQLFDVELGVRLRKPQYRATLNFFLMSFHDEIVPSGGLDQYGVPRTGNADHTRHVGLEIDGAVRVNRSVDLSGNIILSNNRFVSFDEFVTASDFTVSKVRRDGNSIAGFPDVSGNLDATVTAGPLVTNLHASLVGKQYIDNSDGKSVDNAPSRDYINDAFVLVDWSVRYTFSAGSPFYGLRLSLDVNNLLNAEVLTYGNAGFGGPQFFPAATRHLFFGASYTLR